MQPKIDYLSQSLQVSEVTLQKVHENTEIRDTSIGVRNTLNGARGGVFEHNEVCGRSK